MTTDGQLGIDKMEVQFVFDDVTTDSITQKFSVTYKSVSLFFNLFKPISVTYNLQRTTISNFAAFSRITNKW